MLWVTYGLCAVVVFLIIMVIYLHLIQRAALRIGEILYVMAGNVRAKATEVRRDGKDVEIHRGSPLRHRNLGPLYPASPVAQ